MSKPKTITRADLADDVYREVGLSRRNSTQLVEQVLEEMTETLVKGKSAKISSFGIFNVRNKSPRMGRNPKTGEEVPIAARRVLVFRASHVLKDAVNGKK